MLSGERRNMVPSLQPPRGSFDVGAARGSFDIGAAAGSCAFATSGAAQTRIPARLSIRAVFMPHTCRSVATSRFRLCDTFANSRTEADFFEGYKFMAMLPGRKCTHCGWVYLDPAALEQYELLIADRLAALGAKG